jgi:hypothetical protein
MFQAENGNRRAGRQFHKRYGKRRSIMMTREIRMGAVAVVLLGLALGFQAEEPGASAGTSSLKVFINDVEVTGLTSQEFKNCTVNFDEKGNINISAPGYKIKRLDSQDSGESSSASSTTVVTKKSGKKPNQKYFLVTEELQGKKVWDKYSLIVNGSVVKSFESSDGVLLEDISKHFDKGTNQIVITAAKKDNYPGGSKSVWYRVIIGEGHEDGKKIVIDKTLMQLTRKGSDADPDSKSKTVEAK